MYRSNAVRSAKAQARWPRLVAFLLLLSLAGLLCQALPTGRVDSEIYARGSDSGSRTPSPHRDSDSTGLLGDIVRQGTGRRRPLVHSPQPTQTDHRPVGVPPIPPARPSRPMFFQHVQTTQAHPAQLAQGHTQQPVHIHTAQARQAHTAHTSPTHAQETLPPHSGDKSKPFSRLAAIGASYKAPRKPRLAATDNVPHIPKLAAIGASFKKNPKNSRHEAMDVPPISSLGAIGASLKSGSTTNLPKSAKVAWWKQPGGQPQNAFGQSPFYHLHKSYRDKAKLRKALEKPSEHPSGHEKHPPRKGGGPGSPGAGGAGQAVSKRGLSRRGSGSRTPSPHHDPHSTGYLVDVVRKATARPPPHVHSSQSVHSHSVQTSHSHPPQVIHGHPAQAVHGHSAQAVHGHPAQAIHGHPAQTSHTHAVHSTHGHPSQTAQTHIAQTTLVQPKKSTRRVPGYATDETSSGTKVKQLGRLGAIAGALKSGPGLRLPKKERIPWWKQKGGTPQRPDGTGKAYEKDRLYRERKKLQREMEHLIKHGHPPPPRKKGRPPGSPPGGSGANQVVSRRRLGVSHY